MPLFSFQRRQKPRPHGRGSDLELQNLEEEAPNADVALDEIDKALAQSDRVQRERELLQQERTERRGCGCMS